MLRYVRRLFRSLSVCLGNAANNPGANHESELHSEDRYSERGEAARNGERRSSLSGNSSEQESLLTSMERSSYQALPLHQISERHTSINSRASRLLAATQALNISHKNEAERYGRIAEHIEQASDHLVHSKDVNLKAAGHIIKATMAIHEHTSGNPGRTHSSLAKSPMKPTDIPPSRLPNGTPLHQRPLIYGGPENSLSFSSQLGISEKIGSQNNFYYRRNETTEKEEQNLTARGMNNHQSPPSNHMSKKRKGPEPTVGKPITPAFNQSISSKSIPHMANNKLTVRRPEKT